jgi:flagellar M-ring protein FliF
MLERITTIWAGLNGRQRIGGAVVAVAAIVAVVSLTIGSTRTEYAPLYTGLDPSDAGAIVAKLKAAKVGYRLSGGGNAIEVPQDKVCELRITLAQEGLPGNSQSGFELFDKSSLPGTEFSNNVNYQRALQGELGRTISSLQEISSARVHLAIPKPSLFADKEQASASVVLEPKPQAQLTDAQVRGIVHLVSSAVENLKPESVTVLTTRGEFLAGGDAASDGGQLSLAQLGTQREFEEQLRRRLQSMLDASLGVDMSVVRVRAALDFGSEQTDSEIIEPLNGKQGVVSKENTTEEQYAGAKPGSGGVAGVAGNLNARAGSASGQQGSYTNRVEQREYQYSRNVKHAKKSPGTVKQVMVAAVVDESVSNVSNEQITALLSAAAGADPARGDKVVVERMSMASKQVADAEEKKTLAAEQGAQRARLLSSAGRHGWIVVLLAAGAIAVLARRRKSEADDEGAPGEAAGTAQVSAGPSEDRRQVVADIGSADVAQLEEYLRRVTDAQAEAVARQIQVMMEEGER